MSVPKGIVSAVVIFLLLSNIPTLFRNFLGVEFNTDKKSGKVTLTQGGLTKKVLKRVGMLDSNKKTTPAEKIPLGINADGSPLYESWEYACVVGMLVYLSKNYRPDIQFEVHQCARFTHNTRIIYAA